MDSSRLRWERAARAAISPAHYAEERDRITSGVQEYLFGTSETEPNPRSRGLTVTDLHRAVGDRLDEATLRACLAVRYLNGVGDAVSFGDTEDAGTLEAELHWARTFFDDCFAAADSDWERLRPVQLSGYGTERYYDLLCKRLWPQRQTAAAA